MVIFLLKKFQGIEVSTCLKNLARMRDHSFFQK